MGIGRLVFNTLNKVEWVFAIAILLPLLWQPKALLSFVNFSFYIPLIALIIQTVWLLPALDIRAEMHIQNQIVPPSNLHFYYIGMEALKVISLALFGISQFIKQAS